MYREMRDISLCLYVAFWSVNVSTVVGDLVHRRGRHEAGGQQPPEHLCWFWKDHCGECVQSLRSAAPCSHQGHDRVRRLIIILYRCVHYVYVSSVSLVGTV